jgi:excinuclease UvrABC helicase subunit UvrB
MRGMLKPLQSAPGFQSLVRGLENNYTRQLVTGLSGSLKSYLLAGLAEKVKPLPLLVVTPGERDAGIIAEELIELLPGIAVRQFPVLQLLPYQVRPIKNQA